MSSAASALEHIRKEFVLLGGAAFAVLLIVSLFFDRSDPDSSDYFAALDKASRVVIAIFVAAAAFVGYKLYLNMMQEDTLAIKAAFEFGRLQGSGGSSPTEGVYTPGGALARVWDKKKGQWVEPKWSSKHEQNQGFGAFVMGSHDARLMPSRKQKAKAGFGRDLYAENKQELEAAIYRERLERSGVQHPFVHDDGGYTAKKKSDARKKYLKEHPLKSKVEAYVAKNYPSLV